jgi:tetratricopeptide (TPR) repeat protein
MPLDSSRTVNETLTHAKALHRQGRVEQAADLYAAILDCEPRHVDALLLLSMVEHQRQHFERALELVCTALDENPRSVQALVQRAVVLRSLGFLAGALASYEAALSIEPRLPAALYNCANVLLSLGRNEDALASYNAVLALQPGDADALNNRAVVLQKLGRYEAALESCDRALAAKPRYAHALNNRAHALHALERWKEALRNYDDALAIAPNHADALTGRGTLLYTLGRYEEALTTYERAFDVAPDALSAVNVGNALQALGRHESALITYERALGLDPNCVEALNNRGNALQALNRHEDALASYMKASQIAPDAAHAHWNEGLIRLLLGDYERGWEKYEWRWRNQQLNMGLRIGDSPRWRGHEDLRDRTVLVHAEQGFGDSIQFVRYVPMLAARGAAVVLACHESLRPLFARVEGVGEVVTSEHALPRFDYHVSLISLPYAFSTMLNNIPARVPYVSVDKASAQKWRRRIEALGPGFKVGVAWSGNPKFPGAAAKTCSLGQLQGLLEMPGCTFVSLQKGDAASEIDRLGLSSRLKDVSGELADFADTAAVVVNLDLVISIDTAVAHLAGALGKPLWVLLPYSADWRWLTQREDSPWYPSARLFRQSRAGDWDSVLRDVCNALTAAAR